MKKIINITTKNNNTSVQENMYTPLHIRSFLEQIVHHHPKNKWGTNELINRGRLTLMYMNLLCWGRTAGMIIN